MMVGCEHEADAGLLDAFGDGLGGGVDVDAEFIEEVGGAALAGDGPVAMFGDGDAGAGDHKGDGSADVEGRLSVSAGADDVDGV